MSGAFEVRVRSTHPGAADIAILKENISVKRELCQIKADLECSVMIDSSELMDGHYELQLLNELGRPQSLDFFVVNQRPEIEIDLKRSSGADINQTIRGKVYFDISLKSSSVMPAKIELFVEDSQKNILFSQSSELVAPFMRMSLKSRDIKNGEYFIYLKAQTPYKNEIQATFSKRLKIKILN